jgi:hypothetical protein
MTISTETIRASYSGNGSTQNFAYTWPIWDDDELLVYSVVTATGVETLQTKTTHYTVTGVGANAGGNVVMVTAPATGTTLVIKATIPFKQEADLVNESSNFLESIELGLDKAQRQAAVANEKAIRGLQLPEAEATSSTKTVVPALEERKGKYLYFDASSGQPMVQAFSIPAGASLHGTKTWNTGTIGAGSYVWTNITISGAAVGDTVVVTHKSAQSAGSVIPSGYVNAANTVFIFLFNVGGSVTPPSDTAYVRVIKQG